MMNGTGRTLIAVLALLVIGCAAQDGEQAGRPDGSDSTPAQEEVRVDTTTRWELLDSGAHGRTAESGDLEHDREPLIEIATSQQELETLWRRHVGERPVPSVTFEDAIAIFLLLPPQRTAGYSIEPQEVRRSEGTLEVEATFHQPGEGDILAQVITAPWAVLRVQTSVPDRVVWTDRGAELALVRVRGDEVRGER
jgi:hypothetical protein